jgi:23S rRNA (adenine2030-N6)-methyltransferase
MNYRHVFHAGNFADVFKHIFLTRILAYLKRKETAFRFVDTHAGHGLYDLASEEARRSGEWLDGLGRLLAAEAAADVEALIAPYRAIVEPLFLEQPPLYPGSPALAAGLLRRQDRMIFFELYAPAVKDLSDYFGRDSRAKIIEMDGYMGLNAFIPPVERRGLVLIDPPFEEPDEFDRLADAVAAAWRKWETGIYMIWFPIKDPAVLDDFLVRVVGAGLKRLLLLELHLDQPKPRERLVANGLLIVNPPYVLEAEARVLLPHLAHNLGDPDHAGFEIASAGGE